MLAALSGQGMLPRIGEGGRVRELAGVLRALTGKAGRNSTTPGFRNGSG
jgi:hypothetical protein